MIHVDKSECRHGCIAMAAAKDNTVAWSIGTPHARMGERHGDHRGTRLACEREPRRDARVLARCITAVV